MEEEQIYIEQQAVEDALYTHLQKHMLEELQHLSGRVWTDFNAHDPGVTLADTANYVLTELDYKFGFALQDYLTDSQGSFNPEKYSLFHAEEVYTTAPVTVEDYRKLLISQFEELENIQVDAEKDTGNYKIRIVSSPFNNEHTDTKKIYQFFHAHRNLCENLKLEDITTIAPQQLSFHSEFEIEPGYDATDILAEVYWTIIQYLSGSIRVVLSEERILSGLSLEKWMEGTINGKRTIIPEQENTEHELYFRLDKIKGIRSFKTCYLKENGEIRTNFPDIYSLLIPQNANKLKEHVRITTGHSTAFIEMERFIEELQSLYYTKGVSLKRHEFDGKIGTGQAKSNQYPPSTYRNIFNNLPIGKDLPGCYLLGYNDQGNRLSPEKKGHVRQFEAYLKLYDLLAERGLKEVKNLRSLLSTEKDTTILSHMEIFDCQNLLFGKATDYSRNVSALKNKYLDFLDGLYGVDSNPEWMAELSRYGETGNERLLQRMNFLRHVPQLTKNRAGARNICDLRGKDNVPVVKAYFCYLLGMNMDESISVGNILPGYYLGLLESSDKKENEIKGQHLRNRLTAVMISERMLDYSNINPVTLEPAQKTKDEKLKAYEEMRQELAVFNSNIICGGLFRGGIRLNNYKLVKANEKEFLLVFWNEEEKCWMNLERGSKEERLNALANTLRRYLQELNRQSETVYVIEHNLFTHQPMPFTLSFVFPDWTARFRSPRFREICGQLVRSLIPPHLKATLYWLDIPQMQFFEEGYRLWRKALASEILSDNITNIEEGIIAILKEAEKNKMEI